VLPFATNGNAERFIQSAFREWRTAFPTITPESEWQCSIAELTTATDAGRISELVA
jgi:hypothetical protein